MARPTRKELEQLHDEAMAETNLYTRSVGLYLYWALMFKFYVPMKFGGERNGE